MNEDIILAYKHAKMLHVFSFVQTGKLEQVEFESLDDVSLEDWSHSRNYKQVTSIYPKLPV